MTLPLIALAALSIVGGLFRMPGVGDPAEPMALGLALGSSAVALSGIALAWWMYAQGGLALLRVRVLRTTSGVPTGVLSVVGAGLAPARRVVYTTLVNKYYMDDLWGVIVRRITFGLSNGCGWFDRHIVDGAVNVVGAATKALGHRLRYAQTGQAQTYALVMVTGALAAYLATALWR